MIQGYMTTKEAAEQWGVSIRYVNFMCNNGKIPLAQKLGTIWAIPTDTEKPTQDRRVRSGEYRDWRKKYGKRKNREKGLVNKSIEKTENKMETVALWPR